MTRLLEERCHLLRGNRIISLLCLGTDSLSSGQRRLIPRAARAGIQDPGSSRGAAARPWPLSPAPPPLELSRRFSHRCPFSASSPARVSIPGCEHIAVCPKSSLLGNSWKQDRGGNRTASAGTGRRTGTQTHREPAQLSRLSACPCCVFCHHRPLHSAQHRILSRELQGFPCVGSSC